MGHTAYVPGHWTSYEDTNGRQSTLLDSFVLYEDRAVAVLLSPYRGYGIEVVQEGFVCCFCVRFCSLRSIRCSLAICVHVSGLLEHIGMSLMIGRPVQGYWTPGVGICLNEGTTMVANGIVHTVADAMTTALPIPMIMKLRMPKGQKIGVLCLLGLGFIVTIAGIIRFVSKLLLNPHILTR